MEKNGIVQNFERAAEMWLCDSYALDIRVISQIIEDGSYRILSALVLMHPIPSPHDHSLNLVAGGIAITQLQRKRVSRRELINVVADAIAGKISMYGRQMKLHCSGAHDYWSEMTARGRWFNELHIDVVGDRVAILNSMDSAETDDALRAATPPFDGIEDVSAWLGLPHPSSGRVPAITIRIGPPADIMFDKTNLSENKFEVIVNAHPKLAVENVGLAVRAAPGIGLSARSQLGSEIKWSRVREGRRTGKVSVVLENADNALAILMIGGATVRRQWFIDSKKARNNRLLAVQSFDANLRMIRRSLLEQSESSRESSKFELGVAALFYLHGFTPSVQIETEAPDLIVTTPGGRIALIECTLRTADFSTKMGKLVDRRGALSKALVDSGHPGEVLAILVCALPRDQIHTDDRDLNKNQIVLLCKENIVSALDSVRLPRDPDQWFTETASAFAQKKSGILS